MIENLKGKSVKFGAGQKQEGAGRPRKIYTILKEKGYSADDIKTAFGEMAWYTLDELKAVHSDNTKPIITRIVANQFFKAFKDSDWNKIKEILEHTIGKPSQPVSLESESTGGVFIMIPDNGRDKKDATNDV
jgi:hypothetical protein